MLLLIVQPVTAAPVTVVIAPTSVPEGVTILPGQHPHVWGPQQQMLLSGGGATLVT